MIYTLCLCTALTSFGVVEQVGAFFLAAVWGGEFVGNLRLCISLDLTGARSESKKFFVND